MSINFNDVTNITLSSTPVEQVTDSQGNVLWSAAPVVLQNYFYVEDISGSANTLSIQQSNSNAQTIEVFYSTDQTNWSSMGTTSDITPITATIPANGKLYLKATANSWGTSGETYNHISASYNHNIGGNAMSLIYGDNFENQTAFPAGSESNFCGLFRSDTTLLNAENLVLPATTITPLCYEYMFNSCISLLTSPTMSVTTLSHQCCWGMFESCTNLTTAPVLLPTTLEVTCYTFMFSGCNNLSSITTYAQNISADSCLVGWLGGVAATGDFYNLGGATYESGGGGIPSGWTEHNSL